MTRADAFLVIVALVGVVILVALAAAGAVNRPRRPDWLKAPAAPTKVPSALITFRCDSCRKATTVELLALPPLDWRCDACQPIPFTLTEAGR